MEITGFEHLHRHSHLSLLDGFSMVEEYARYSKEVNQKYLSITDHGVMGAIPAQILQSDKHNLKPIFGIEFYLNPLQPKVKSKFESAEFRKDLDESQRKIFDKPGYHLLALAYNFTGYQNLVRMSSWAWIHGFYKKPRINHEIIQKHKEGIIFTSTCANSEIAQAFLKNRDDQEGFDMLEKYIEMIGKDHFYLELMMLDFKLQKPYDEFLIRAHDKYNLPLVLTQDCHYCKKEHSKYQQYMLMQKGKKTLADIEMMISSGEEDIFELQDTNLWMKSEEELNDMWFCKYQNVIDYDLYKQAKINSVEICKKAEGVELDRTIKLPQFDQANKRLMECIMQGYESRKVPKTKKYIERIKEEYNLICKKGFSSYFLIQKEMTDAARRKSPEILGWGDGGEAVGPGRGSVVGSLIAYCLNLHDVDPIEHDLLFSRFLSPARGGKQMKVRFTKQSL